MDNLSKCAHAVPHIQIFYYVVLTQLANKKRDQYQHLV